MGRVRSRFSIVGIALFVALDIFLVYAAVRHTNQRPPQSAPPAAESSTPSADNSPSPNPSAKPDEPLYMSVAADGTLIRATRGGGCHTGSLPTVIVSTGSGHRSPNGRGSSGEVTAVLRVQADNAHDVWLVGTGRDCTISGWTSGDGGASWTRSPAGTSSEWYLAPDATASKLHVPGGMVRTPCVPDSLSTTATGVFRVLCTDGTIIGTDDQGQSWVVLGRLDGAVAIRYLSPGDGYAVAPTKNCPAALMRTSDGGASWSEAHCFDAGPPRSVAADGKLVVVGAGDRLYESTDAANTWHSRTG